MQQPERQSSIDRLLRIFTEVRAGESRTVLLLTLNVFLILCAYYLIRPVREALILAVEGGPELKSYLSAGQAALLLGAVPLYGILASRFPRRRLINIVTAFFIACLLAFFFLAQLDVPLAVVFFIWVGIFNLMVVAQFWSFANDVYTTNEGERLFPIVVVGASAGAVVGAFIAGRLIGPLGNEPLFLRAGAVLVGAVLLTNVVDMLERRRTEAELPDINTTATMPAATGQFRTQTGALREAGEEYRTETGEFRIVARDKEPREEPMSKRGAFRLVARNRYLLLIALLTMFLNWVNTTGEYMLGRVVAQDAADKVAAGIAGGLTESQLIGVFYSNFLFGVSLGGFLIQLFVVSRILKYFGVRTAILVLPIIALVGYTVLALIPLLGAVRWAKTAENATDYSLNNTVRNALFLPTTREEKYKAKQVTDAFFWRAGDVLSAVLVFVGVNLLAFQTRHFALVNIVLVIGMIVMAVAVGRRYQRLAAVTAE